ncbi:MAG TPA: hypothetical protein VFL12_11505 [Thermoanaerobaculia bacterium]|nr:hypothetical protein [Thermoanaerobaculia bacterium]
MHAAMHALRPVALAAVVAAVLPLSAQTTPKPPIAGCGVVTDPPVTPQIRLQTPPGRREAIRRQGRGSTAGTGATVVVPGSPVPPWPVCATDIGAAISGDAISPGAIGIAMNVLGDGFHATSVTLGSVCTSKAGSPDSVAVLQTSWSVDGSDVPLQLSQQPQAEPSANRIDGGSATFWWQGYVYDLSVAGPVPVEAGTGVGAPAGTGPDDAGKILLRAIAELAPGLDVSCFAQRKTGTWSDLAALGLGDPRPAIPPDYALADFQLTYLAAPPCASAPPADTELVLSATFASPAGGWIGIGAWSLGGSAPYPGTLQDGFVAWSSDKYQFSVSGSSGDGMPLPSATLAAIANALDPTFSAACTLREVTLSPADLPPLGFHAPSAPDGYALVESSLTGEVLGAGCTRTFAFGGTYDLFWSFAGADGFVTASAFRVVTDHPGPRTDPVVSDSCITWTDDRGTSFFVGGGAASPGTGPALAVLIGVARSMDPGLVLPN